MYQLDPEFPRRRAEDDQTSDCCDVAGRIGDEICEKVLSEVCRANRGGTPITIWDLPKLTGLPLHTAFAAVRTLEFGRLLFIDDSPTDPFGATLRTRAEGIQQLDTRRVA